VGPTFSPTKGSDKRRFEGDTVQAEAIPPDVLVNLVRDAIDARQDAAIMADTRAEEQRIRANLRKRYVP
jgi:hypothetical protein